jgi:hypothetical protein
MRGRLLENKFDLLEAAHPSAPKAAARIRLKVCQPADEAIEEF